MVPSDLLRAKEESEEERRGWTMQGKQREAEDAAGLQKTSETGRQVQEVRRQNDMSAGFEGEVKKGEEVMKGTIYIKLTCSCRRSGGMVERAAAADDRERLRNNASCEGSSPNMQPTAPAATTRPTTTTLLTEPQSSTQLLSSLALLLSLFPSTARLWVPVPFFVSFSCFYGLPTAVSSIEGVAEHAGSSGLFPFPFCTPFKSHHYADTKPTLHTFIITFPQQPTLLWPSLTFDFII